MSPLQLVQLNQGLMSQKQLQHFLKPCANKTLWNSCNVNCMSNLRKHSVKHKIYLQAEECTMFENQEPIPRG